MRNTLIIILQLLILSAKAQNSHNIIGKILNSENKPIEYAQVTILRLEDSTIIQKTKTDNSGQFTVTVMNGNYILKCSYLGHNSFSKSILVMQNLNIGNITLTENNKLLSEAIVSAQRNSKASNIDKREYSPTQLLSSQNASAAELINALPSMNMGNEGNNLSFRGDENVAVMINGKMTALSGDNLSQIPANSIEKIEVISVPNSKYNSEGSAGVINIVLKNAKSTFNSGYILGSIGNNNKYNAQIGYNYTLNKFSLTGSYNFTYNEFENYGFSMRTYKNNLLYTNYGHQSDGERIKRLHNIRLGADYELNKRNSISIIGSISKDWGSSFANDLDTFKDANSNFYSLWNLTNLEKDINTLYDFNLSYSHTLKNDRDKLSVEVSRSDNLNDKTALYTRNFEIYETNLGPKIEQYRVDNMQKRPISAIQTDFSMRIHKNQLLETGLRAANRDFVFTNLYTDITSGESIVAKWTNNFNYNENVFSTYGLMTSSWNDKWTTKIGLRLEQTNTESFNNDSSLFQYNYFNAFPSGIIKYNISPKAGSVSASYSMRINRPGPGMLNPLQDIADPISKRFGNPRLQPEIINSYELAYGNDFGKKISMSSSVYYKVSNNSITRYMQPNSDGTFSVNISNIGKTQFTGWELIGSIKINAITSFNLSSNLSYNQLEFNNQGIQYTQNYLNWQGRGILNYKLPLGIEGQLIAFYKSPFRTPQGKIDFVSNIDATFRKKVFKQKGLIILSIFDIFNDTKFFIEANDVTFDNLFNRKRETRYATLAFRYNFGSDSISKKPKIEKPEPKEGGGDMGM